MSFFKELNKVRKNVNDAIREILEKEKEPCTLHKASYHLLKAGGKRLRPFLVIKSCEIVGGRCEDALPVAVAIELLHNFTLIHDDIMDKSEKRRGVPTVHTLWGIPIAIDAGDLLFAKVYEVILKSTNRERVSPERILQILSLITRAMISICRGQAYDLSFEERTTIEEWEYLNMIRLKTAALYEASAKIGAIIGNGSEEEVEALGLYGLNMGMAFQIVDDILGLIGKEDILKKPVGDDIREGKKTLPLIHSLKHASAEEKQRIFACLGKRDATKEEITNVIRLIEALKGIEYARIKARSFIEEAKNTLNIFPASPAKTSLLELADFVFTRIY